MIGGTRVGIIGLANDDVTALAAACPQTTFRDARTTLQHYVAELEAQGIRHIIAVTHLGLERDKELARSVNRVDVIVGGHSHTYLGPGSTEGPYPHRGTRAGRCSCPRGDGRPRDPLSGGSEHHL